MKSFLLAGLIALLFSGCGWHLRGSGESQLSIDSLYLSSSDSYSAFNQQFRRALAAQGIEIIGINYKDEPDKALAFLDELGNPYAAIGADPEARNALEWGLYGVPETYVVDSEGTITFRFAGPITPSILQSTILPEIEAAR